MNRERINLVSVLFFLAILQHLPIRAFTGIDFLLSGLILSGYFLNLPWVICCAAASLMLMTITSGSFQFFLVLYYLSIPALTQKISRILNLTFQKYYLLCFVFLFLYIAISLLVVGHFGLKNFFICLFKNTVSFSIIYMILKDAVTN